jgi:hypothetical protein
MHELLSELKSPIAFAIIALVSLLLKRFIGSEINSHVASYAKETRDNTTNIAVIKKELEALWRYHDERNNPCDEEE